MTVGSTEQNSLDCLLANFSAPICPSITNNNSNLWTISLLGLPVYRRHQLFWASYCLDMSEVSVDHFVQNANLLAQARSKREALEATSYFEKIRKGDHNSLFSCCINVIGSQQFNATAAPILAAQCLVFLSKRSDSPISQPQLDAVLSILRSATISNVQVRLGTSKFKFKFRGYISILLVSFAAWYGALETMEFFCQIM